MPADDIVGESCLYELDEEERIVSVGGTWTSFAIANGAPELAPPAPLGRPIYASISDPTTSHIYSELYARVRAHQRTIEFQVRCDGPAVRRLLRLRLSPANNARVQVESTLLRAEPREAITEAAESSADAELLRVCGWCKLVELGMDWVEVEVAIDRLALLERGVLPRFSHGICPRCEAAMMRTLDELEAS